MALSACGRRSSSWLCSDCPRYVPAVLQYVAQLLAGCWCRLAYDTPVVPMSSVRSNTIVRQRRDSCQLRSGSRSTGRRHSQPREASGLSRGLSRTKICCRAEHEPRGEDGNRGRNHRGPGPHRRSAHAGVLLLSPLNPALKSCQLRATVLSQRCTWFAAHADHIPAVPACLHGALLQLS